MLKLLLEVLSLVSVVYTANVSVVTDYGTVIGHTIDVFNGRESRIINSFLAIPFAKETSGSRRFSNPEPPEPWTEPFIADTLGDTCPQSLPAFFIMTHPLWDQLSEDCLNLNIYAPNEPPTGSGYAVMLWLYGGAFQGGGNIQYPGHFLATRDLVIVVANYRVGNLGYMFTNNSACPGNAALFDQKMALEFVVNNIAAFGGDPDRITVFGQSAGAASAAFLVVSPHTKDLFHQAIMESGTEASFWAVNGPESTPQDYTYQVAEQINCHFPGDDQRTIDCMRALPWQEVYNVTFQCTPGYFCLGMAPVVDGPDGFLPKQPALLRDDGDIMRGPIITGINRDDGSFYTLVIIPESLLGGFNSTEFEYYIRERLMPFWEDSLEPQAVEDSVQAVMYNYRPWPYINDEYGNRDAFNEMITDAAYGLPWDRQLKLHSTLNENTFGYVYDYRGRQSTRIFPEWMGVPHMGELPYVWGYPLLLNNPAVRNDSRIFFDIIPWTDEDIAHAIFWQDLYANFAKFGDPTPSPVECPSTITEPDNIMWLPHSYDDQQVLYVTNTTVRMETAWRQEDYGFWTDYMLYVGTGTTLPNGFSVPDGVLEEMRLIAEEYLEDVLQRTDDYK